MNGLIVTNQMTSMQIAEITLDTIPANHCKDKQQGIVYVLSAGGFVKIGRTSNPRQRIPAVIKVSGRLVSKIAITPFCNNFVQLETSLHKKFSFSRRVGEWFSVDYGSVVQAMKTFEFDMTEKKPKDNIGLLLFNIAMQMDR